MQDFAIVAVLQSEADLCEVVQDLILSEVLEHASLLLVLVLILDLRLHIAIVSIVHHDAQLALLCLVDLAETNDIGVAEDLQDFCLTQSLFALVIRHLLDINLLDDGVSPVGLALNKVCRAERARAQSRHLLIRLVLLFLYHNVLRMKIKF